MSNQLLSKEECKLGMKVYLVKPDSFYVLNEKNPVKGSIYSCTGSIIKLDSDPGIGIKVKWKNGSSNYYKSGELSLVKTAKYHSIWLD